MKLFKCQSCGQLLYFENTSCERCSHRLGYLPQAFTVSAVEPAGERWKALADPERTVPVLRQRRIRRLQLAD